MITPPDDAAVVEVLGQQWQWRFRFPGEDGRLGLSDIRFISPANPFGLNPDDPHGQDDVLVDSPELRLPRGLPVIMLLRSRDVLHNFYVPQFRTKMDLVPGLVTRFWLTPTRAGRFEILCAELCGLGHYNMRGHVVVEDEAAFRTWLAAQPTFARSRTASQ
jgi:cytochrome c oxidase subunit II